MRIHFLSDVFVAVAVAVVVTLAPYFQLSRVVYGGLRVLLLCDAGLLCCSVLTLERGAC